MITVTGAPTFKQYMAAYKFGLLHGTFGNKLYFIAIVYALPCLCIIGLPYSAWLYIEAWRSIGGQTALFDSSGFMLVAWLFFLFYRFFIYRWKMHRRYKQQDIDKPVAVELSEQGIHINIPLKADMRMEWAVFSAFAEIPGLFLLITRPRNFPIMLPANHLSAAEQAEIRALFAAHLKPIR